MTTCLVNAVSSKHGGARTIIESFVAAAAQHPETKFVVLAGFEASGAPADNVEWIYLPRSGAKAVAFNLFFVFRFFRKYRCRTILSFNNTNCVLIPSRRRVTYLHQPKALDPLMREAKARFIRFYMRSTNDRVFVQSPQVRSDFVGMFGSDSHSVSVAWPGLTIPEHDSVVERKRRELLIPISSPDSPHKNFAFVVDTAELLGPNWNVLVTAKSGIVNGRIPSNIRFVGPQSHSELFSLYRKASCVMLASTHETIGLPVFESLAVGTPVVAFDANYIRSFKKEFGITSGLEISATPEDAKRWIEALAFGQSKIQYSRDFRSGDWDKVFEVV